MNEGDLLLGDDSAKSKFVSDCCSGRSDLQLHAELFLKGPQDSKEACSAWVSRCAQHPMQALAGNLYKGCQLLETNSGIDEIFEDGFANCFFTAQVSIQRLG